MNKGKQYVIVFTGFIVIMVLLFSEKAGYLSLQQFGWSVGGVILLTIIALNFWWSIEYIMGKRQLNNMSSKERKQKIFLPTKENLKALFVFVFLIIAIVVLWTFSVHNR